MDLSGFTEDDVSPGGDLSAECETLMAAVGWRKSPAYEQSREYVLSFMEEMDFLTLSDVFVAIRDKWHRGLFATSKQRAGTFYDAMDRSQPGWRKAEATFLHTVKNTLETLAVACNAPHEYDYKENCAVLRHFRLRRAEAIIARKSLCMSSDKSRPNGEFVLEMRRYYDSLAGLQASSGEILRWLPSRLK